MAPPRKAPAAGSSSPQQQFVLLVGTVLAVSLVSLMLTWHFKKKRNNSSNKSGALSLLGSSSSNNNKQQQQQEQRHTPLDTSDPVLVARFQQAATQLSAQIQSLSNGDRLILYGLYKQSVMGDCDDHHQEEPSRLHFVEHAKYHAWRKFGGMPCKTAMEHYIEAVDYFLHHNHQENDDNDENDVLSGGGMGLRPSMPQSQQDDDDDDDEDDMATLSPEASWEERLRHAARHKDYKALVRAVEQHDAMINLDAPDDSGETALHFAADRGSVDMVNYLLQHGANPNAVDLEGISVLQAAVIAGHVGVARALLEAGALADHEDMDGDTPRSCAEDDGSEDMKRLFDDLPRVVEEEESL